MRLFSLIMAAAFIATPVFAQQAQKSSNTKGVQIQGNTDISASTSNTSASATGQDNVAKNTAGAIKGGTQIQGNTKINASQSSATATVSGKNNKAVNEAGVIGCN